MSNYSFATVWKKVIDYHVELRLALLKLIFFVQDGASGVTAVPLFKLLENDCPRQEPQLLKIDKISCLITPQFNRILRKTATTIADSDAISVIDNQNQIINELTQLANH
ncbi:MAG: hypothetical protein AAFQ80_14675 [Cyanobacteria bacterium J06621_8]